VEHNVSHEAEGDQRGQVSEAEREREEVDVKENKVDEEESREESNRDRRAHGDRGVDFTGGRKLKNEGRKHLHKK